MKASLNILVTAAALAVIALTQAAPVPSEIAQKSSIDGLAPVDYHSYEEQRLEPRVTPLNAVALQVDKVINGLRGYEVLPKQPRMQGYVYHKTPWPKGKVTYKSELEQPLLDKSEISSESPSSSGRFTSEDEDEDVIKYFEWHKPEPSETMEPIPSPVQTTQDTPPEQEVGEPKNKYVSTSNRVMGEWPNDEHIRSLHRGPSRSDMPVPVLKKSISDVGVKHARDVEFNPTTNFGVGPSSKLKVSDFAATDDAAKDGAAPTLARSWSKIDESRRPITHTFPGSGKRPLTDWKEVLEATRTPPPATADVELLWHKNHREVQYDEAARAAKQAADQFEEVDKKLEKLKTYPYLKKLFYGPKIKRQKLKREQRWNDLAAASYVQRTAYSAQNRAANAFYKRRNELHKMEETRKDREADRKKAKQQAAALKAAEEHSTHAAMDKVAASA